MYVGLMLLALTVILLSTASHTLDLPLTLLFPGVMVVVVAVGIFFLHHPVLPLYTVVFLSFLPRGLIPQTILPPLYFMIILWALGSWLFTMVLKHRPFVWPHPLLLLVASLIWSVVTLAWASDLVVARRELVQYVYVITMLFLLINQIDSLRTLDGLMHTLALNGWIFVLAGIGSVLFTGYEFGSRLKIFGTNENGLGIILILTLSGVLWGVIRSPPQQRTMKVLLSLIFVSLSFFLIALSGSRGSLGSLLILMTMFWLWKPTRLWAKFSLFLVALALIATPIVFLTLQNRLADPDEDQFGSRLSLWHAGALLILEHPIGGVGIGNGPYILPAYINSLGRSTGMRQEFPAHNPILEVGVDAGIPGILLYLSALGSSIWTFFRRFLYFNRVGASTHSTYCALVASISMGYFFSWIKSGGSEYNQSYFLMLALLIISARLRPNESDALVEMPTT